METIQQAASYSKEKLIAKVKTLFAMGYNIGGPAGLLTTLERDTDVLGYQSIEKNDKPIPQDYDIAVNTCKEAVEQHIQVAKSQGFITVGGIQHLPASKKREELYYQTLVKY